MKEFFIALVDGVKTHPTAFLCLLVSAVSLLLGLALWWLFSALEKAWKNRAKRRREKLAQKRNIQFALPDKDNAFVRERLRFVLNAEKDETEEDTPKSQIFFQFLYAQKLLVKLGEKQLSTAERLELMEMNKFLGANLHQTSWNAQDIRAVNDCFSRLLKLSAKYAIELPA